MIGAVLDRETCKVCRNCCWYTDIDVWDAPGFTKDELKLAKKLVADPVYKVHGLFLFKMDKRQGKYICPLLSEVGCLLGLEKPFKCAIWPLYVVRIGDHIALAVSNECSYVYQLSNEELLNRLGGVIAQIAARIKDAPELIEPFREHFRVVAELD